MSKELEALESIFKTIEMNWEREPYEYSVFGEDDERFNILFKALEEKERQEKELEIYKKLIVITSSGVKLNLDALIELKKLVGECDE